MTFFLRAFRHGSEIDQRGLLGNEQRNSIARRFHKFRPRQAAPQVCDVCVIGEQIAKLGYNISIFMPAPPSFAAASASSAAAVSSLSFIARSY